MSEKPLLRSRPQPSSSERSEMTNVQIRVKGYDPIRRPSVFVVAVISNKAFFRKIDHFFKNRSKFSFVVLAPHVMSTTETPRRQIGTNPLTRICTFVISERSEELGWGRERKIDFSDMWHMLKKLENRCFLLYTVNVAYECIEIWLS